MMPKNMLNLQADGKQVTSLEDNALLLATRNPATLPTDAVISLGDLAKGWIAVSGTWTYASPTTVNVPSGAPSAYKKGWGIRYKQGGDWKYAYIVNIVDALLTVTGGSDYSVANAAITDVAYSPNPGNALGFPSYFNHPTLINGTGGSAGAYGETVFINGIFSIQGGLVNFQSSKVVTNKGSWSGTVQINLPVAGNFTYAGIMQHPPCWWAAGAGAGASKAVLRLDNSAVGTFLDYINSSFFNWDDLAVSDFLILNVSYYI
jgi:hypothetical protein